MKPIAPTLLIVALICSITGWAQIENKTYREGDLTSLLAGINSDEKLQLERLTAFHFHQLINQHRIANRVKTLYWDDNLWLASRNHCVYMNTNGQLSHAESGKKENSTGGQPEIRTNYVTYQLKELSGGGENILYTDVDEESLETMAKSTAEEAFDIWEKSLGHNQNMLSSQYFAHGTAFIYGNTLWATTVFADPPTVYSKDEISISWDPELAKKYPSSYTQDGLPFKERTWKLKDTEFKMFGLIINNMKDRELEKNSKIYLAASKHFEYLKKEGGTGLMEEKSSTAYYNSTSKKRFLKATHQFGMFKLFSNKIHEVAFSYTIPLAQLKDNSALEQLENKLLNDYPIPKGAKEWGGLVKLIEENGVYICYVDIMFLTKKK
ncbi:MAG: hypothetical protein ACI837_000574 [Crocinitomicaceae bacterium]|jgi:hypothetical protein